MTKEFIQMIERETHPIIVQTWEIIDHLDRPGINLGKTIKEFRYGELTMYIHHAGSKRSRGTHAINMVGCGFHTTWLTQDQLAHLLLLWP